MKNSKKLSREEMKAIAGGTHPLTTWKCQDVPNGPYISVACSDGDPAGAPNCPEYSCYNTFVSCSMKSGCS